MSLTYPGHLTNLKKIIELISLKPSGSLGTILFKSQRKHIDFDVYGDLLCLSISH